MKTRHTYLNRRCQPLLWGVGGLLSCLFAFALFSCASPDEECFYPKSDEGTGTLFIRFPQGLTQPGTRNEGPNWGEGGTGNNPGLEAWSRVNNEHIARIRVIIFTGGACEVNQLFERYTYDKDGAIFGNDREITGTHSNWLTDTWVDKPDPGNPGVQIQRNGIKIEVSPGIKDIFVIANEHPSQTKALNAVRSRQAIYDFMLPTLPNALDNGDQFLTGSPVYQLFNDDRRNFTETDPTTGATVTITDRGTWFLPMTGRAQNVVVERNDESGNIKHVDIMLNSVIARLSLNFKMAVSQLVAGRNLYIKQVVLRNNVRESHLWSPYTLLSPDNLFDINNPIFRTILPNEAYYDLVMDFTEGGSIPNGVPLTNKGMTLPHSPAHNNHLIVYENLAGNRGRGTQLILTVWDGLSNTEYSVYLNEEKKVGVVKEREAEKIGGYWWAKKNVGTKAIPGTRRFEFADKATDLGGLFTFSQVDRTGGSGAFGQALFGNEWDSANPFTWVPSYNPCPPGYTVPSAVSGTWTNGSISLKAIVNGAFLDLINTPSRYGGVEKAKGGVWTADYEGSKVSGRVFGGAKIAEGVYAPHIFLPAAASSNYFQLRAGNGNSVTLAADNGLYWTNRNAGSVSHYVRFRAGDIVETYTLKVQGSDITIPALYRIAIHDKAPDRAAAAAGIFFDGFELSQGSNNYGEILSKLAVRCVWEDNNNPPYDDTNVAHESVIKFNAGEWNWHPNYLILRGHCYHLNGEINIFDGEISRIRTNIEIAPREVRDLGKREVNNWQ